MYLPAGQACNQPNSGSPMTQARITAQAVRIMRRGQAFTDGNKTLNNLMAHLTPPVARPSCGDLQSSRGLRAASPFPDPGGGPSPTVNLMSPAQMQNWFDAWAASSSAAAQRANYGAIAMPTVGGSSPGVSSGPAAAPGAPGSSGSAGSAWPAGVPWSWSLGGGVNATRATCTNPEVLPVDTVDRPPTTSGARSSSLPAPAAAKPAWEFWATLGLVALGIYAISEA
jgi:hypothetical protein